MKQHIKPGTLLKYAANIVTANEKAEIERHLRDCLICHTKATIGFARMSDSCRKAREYMPAYAADSLSQRDRDFMRFHLLACDACLHRYHDLQEINENLAFDNKKTVAEGSLSVSYKIPMALGRQENLKERKRGKDGPLFEIRKKDLVLFVNDDSKGQLKVYLSSEKYSVSGVSVSLGKKNKVGFEPLATTRTSSKGIANLGKLKALQTMPRKAISDIQLSGLRKKDK